MQHNFVPCLQRIPCFFLSNATIVSTQTDHLYTIQKTTASKHHGLTRKQQDQKISAKVKAEMVGLGIAQ